MTMWNLAMRHAASDTSENLGAYLHHSLCDVMAGQVEYLAVDHGSVKRTWPGIGNSPTKIVTNFSFKDGTSVYFTATKIEPEGQPQADLDAPVAVTARERYEEYVESATTVRTRAELVARKPRPDWANKRYDMLGATAQLTVFNSVPLEVPLSRHRAEELTTRRLRLAHAEVWVRQTLADAEPNISLNRFEFGSNGFELVPGSAYSLSIDDAAELARALLLAVEVAREGTPQEVAL